MALSRLNINKNKNMQFFNSESQDENLSRNVAFQSLVAMRDALSIATKAQQPPTYEQSLRMYYELDTEIYDEFDSLLSIKNESDTVKYYKEKANLESIVQEKTIEPSELIETEITNSRLLKRNAEAKKEDTKYIDRNIALLCSALENLKPRRLSENAILMQDTFHTDRDYTSRKIDEDCKFVDFALGKERFLRIRFLHPDNAEHITGADLIYEQINIDTKKLRFVFLQYKTWDERNTIYFSKASNLIPQIEKLQKTLCGSGYCSQPKDENEKYRLPYCCGFLRPTDKLQFRESKMVSSGIHIPVCHVIKKKDEVGLYKNELSKYNISHKIFEEMFNLNLLGSRWLDIDEVEDFYIKHGILDPYQSVKLHAREILTSNEVETWETK